MKTEKKNIVVLSGAGISQESGLRTFRDSNGRWEGYDISEVATPEGWMRNPDLVLEFYNMRRRQARQAVPNAAHLALVDLESVFNVTIVTQNVDDLHERAGSTRVLHLHGELSKAQSTGNPAYVTEIEGTELLPGDACPSGHQLRPHIVWFGEPVPMMEDAITIVEKADIMIIVGTSLVVYPAAGLVDFAPNHCQIHLVDPAPPNLGNMQQVQVHRGTACQQIPALVAFLSP